MLMSVGSWVRVHAIPRSQMAYLMDVPWPGRPRPALRRLTHPDPSPWRRITIDTSGGW